MSYALYYNADDDNPTEIEIYKFMNKDEIINHLLWMINLHEPNVLSLIYPDKSGYLYGKDERVKGGDEARDLLEGYRELGE